MSSFRDLIGWWVAGTVAAVVVLVVGLLAPARVRGLLVRLRRWLPGLALLATIILFLFVLPRTHPPAQHFGDSALPRYFRRHYWFWVLAAILGLAGSAWALWRECRVGRGRLGAGGPLDEAWAALLARLAQARIDLARKRVHLLLAPDRAGEGRVVALIRSAGLRIFAEAPAGPAPVHAYAIPDGVLLSCDGEWARGLNSDGAARVADLGRKLRVRGPDRPAIAGLAVLFPIDWADRPEAINQATVAGEEVQILYHALQARIPVLALFPGLENVPGAHSFIARMAAVDPRKTEIRVGFEVPSSRPFDGELARGALDWIASWFHASVLDLLVVQLFDYRENAELVRFDYELRSRRRRLAQVLELAFSALPHDDEAILFRGGYFTAASDATGERAFAVGLFHGPRHPILAERRGATWTEGAVRDDAKYRWAALGLGLAVGVPAVLAWWVIASRYGSVGWSGLATLAVAWVVVLLWPRRAGGSANRPDKIDA